MNIFCLNGSLRKNSSNLILLQALKDFTPSCEIYPSLGELPHFNPDLDGDLMPPGVSQFRQKIHKADVLVISTPEYAHGVPGVLKNALDWLVSDPHFGGKKVALLYGSASEASHAHVSLTEILKTMSADVIRVLNIPGIRMKVSDEGRVVDQEVQEQLKGFLAGL